MNKILFSELWNSNHAKTVHVENGTNTVHQTSPIRAPVL
jgi:hypothetical protein